MTKRVLWAALALMAVCGVGGCRAAAPQTPPHQEFSAGVPHTDPAPVPERLAAIRWPDGVGADSAVVLSPFASKAELASYLKKIGALAEPEPSAKGNMWGDAVGDSFGAGGLGLSGAAAGSAQGANESVTNVQHAGVDEGGIVKVHGDHLVVLRRGRLFSIRISDLAVVSMIDAYPPFVDPSAAWYDEMLVSKDTIVVIGYSYARGGTEIGLFDIASDGRMRPRDTYHLRSDDYYSSRDYASRLIGDKLVFYTPLAVRGTERAPFVWMPALRKWHVGARAAEFTTIVDAPAIDRPLWDDEVPTLHTVTVCDLAKRELSCKARGVMGPPGRVFYVAPDAVYVWTTPWMSAPSPASRPARSLLYRLPLDASLAPTAVRTRGAPTDSYSFREKNGTLEVLLRADANGDAMWLPEWATEANAPVALLRMSPASFSRLVSEVPGSSYVGLPTVLAGGAFQNRFVGKHVLYGTGTTWGYPGPPRDGRIQIYKTDGTEPPMRVPLGHSVDRIEAIGDDALVVGADHEDLHFSAIGLAGTPALAGRYTRHDAAQGETRSHGFFYSSAGERTGVFGLPIRSGGEPGYRQLRDESASIVFVRNEGLRFKDLGALEGRAKTTDDKCRASCVDWYGNARPLFLRGKLYALLGYEIVEGKLDGARVAEVRRATFAPGTAP